MGESKKSSKMDWGKDIPEADANLCLLCKHVARGAASSTESDAASVAVSNATSAAASNATDPTVARLGRVCTFKLNDQSYSVHRNCLYASPTLGNNDVLRPGCTFGFGPENIYKEAQREKNLCCYLCERKGAVHGCSKKECRRSLHLYCAAKCNLLCLFKENHFVYCEKHAVGFLAGTDYVQEDQPTSGAENKSGAVAHVSKKCCICKMHAFENDAMKTGVGDPLVQLEHAHVKSTADAAKPWTALRLTCCQRSNNDAAEKYAHRWCLGRFSERKGMKSLKCPNCHCYEPFHEYLTRNGIFLEDKADDDDELMPLSPLPPNVDSGSGNAAVNDDAHANADDPNRDDADLNELAASRASSRSSSSTSLSNSVLSVHSLMPDDDDESGKPVKRAKLGAGPSTANLKVEALPQPASFMRSTGNKNEALSNVHKSDTVEKRSIRFGFSDAKMRLFTTGDLAHGACRSCGRAEKVSNLSSIATQTDDSAPNDEASTFSLASFDAMPSNAVDAGKSPGGVPSLPERSAAAEEKKKRL